MSFNVIQHLRRIEMEKLVQAQAQVTTLLNSAAGMSTKTGWFGTWGHGDEIKNWEQARDTFNKRDHK